VGSTDERDVRVWWRRVKFRGDDLPGVRGLVPEFKREVWLRATRDGAQWLTSPNDKKGVEAWEGIGEIPAAVLRFGPVDEGEFWPQAPLDMLYAQRATDHDLTDHGDVGRMQGHGIGWIRAHASKEVKLGLRDYVEVPPDGEGGAPIGVAGPGADLAGLESAASYYLSAVVAHQGLNPAVYQRSAGVTALAKAIELADRAIEQRRHEDALRRAEQRIWDLSRMWAQKLRGETLPDVELVIDYQARPLPQEPQAQAQALSTLVTAGVIGRVQARARVDGVSEAEALRRLQADAEADRGLSGVADDRGTDTDRGPADGA
jgi:hypothetical protein